MKKYLFSLLLLLPFVSSSQCTIVFDEDSIVTCANNPIEFIASAVGTIVVADSFDFNSPSIPAGWTVSGGATFGSPCTPSLDGSSYYWASTSGGGIPSIETDNYMFADSGSVIFDLILAQQGGSSPCEGPDEQDEGVSVQHSEDNGLTWTSFAYFSPSGVILTSNPGGNTSVASGPTAFTTWNTYELPFPNGGLGSTSKFRFIQTNSSGTCCDNWGIDNIKIQGFDGDYTVDWSTGLTNSNSLLVSSAVDTQYIAYGYDTLGVLQCQDTCNLYIFNGGFDNGVQLIPSNFTIGQVTHTIIDAYNEGCPVTSGSITLVLDTALTFYLSVPAPNSINGDTLVYNYSGLGLGLPHFTVDLSTITSVWAQIGDTISMEVMIEDIVGDVNPSNNIKEYEFPVLASYDPNDKKVYPRGDCSPGYVLNDQLMTYTVRFQNVGNGPATDVVIKDVIDANLDPSTLKVVAASHDMYVDWVNASTVEFIFEDIMLPSTIADPIESVGYVVFEIEQDQGLAHGTPFLNNAEIFFDINPAIVTNVVKNAVTDGSHFTVGDTLEVTVQTVGYVWNGQFLDVGGVYTQIIPRPNDCDSIAIFSLIIADEIGLDELNGLDLNFYPNPTSGIVKINGVSGEGIVEVFNSTGERVFKSKYSEGEEIDLSLLAKGLYVIDCTVGEVHHRGRLIIAE